MGVAFPDADHGWAVGDGGTILNYTTPAAPTVAISGADNAWHDWTVDLTATATVDPSCTLADLQFTTDGGSTWSEVPGSGDVRTLPISAEGTTDVIVRVTDSDGATASDSAIVKIDTTAPTVNASGASNGVWLNHAATVTLSAADPGGSGVASITTSLDGVPLLTVGTSTQVMLWASANHTLGYWATDLAGNVSAEQGPHRPRRRSRPDHLRAAGHRAPGQGDLAEVPSA